MFIGAALVAAQNLGVALGFPGAALVALFHHLAGPAALPQPAGK
jgi:hypothetical protein